MGIIRALLGIYALMQLVHFALPYATNTQQPWMTTLARFCEPGVRIGNQVAAKLLPDRRFKVNVGPVAAAILCFVVRIILGMFR